MGDIRINRRLFNSDLWQHKPFSRGQAWVDLIGLANWKDNMVIIRDDNFHLKRGQLVGSYRFLGKRWGWGAKRVSNLCQTLKRQQRITLSTQHQTTIITVCKYDSYQTPLNYKATAKETAKETVRQQSGNSEATKQRTKEEQKKKGKRTVLTNKERDFPFIKDKDFSHTYQDYLQMRKEKKRPATDRAEELVLTELHKYDLQTAIAMLEQSIVGSYQGIFPLKKEKKNGRYERDGDKEGRRTKLDSLGREV